MNSQLMHQHGGDLDSIQQKYGIPKEQILDFSGNINPLGFPESVQNKLAENLHIISTYPDKHYTTLRHAISQYTGAAMEHIVVGNGSSELISAFIKTINARKTLIMGPAYSEYEREAQLCGSTFSYFPLKEEDNFQLDVEGLLDSLTQDVGLFIACNPNNPTGSIITTSQMEVILAHCKRNDIAVMIDETYIEFCDTMEEVCSIPLVEKYENLFIIRGISKFFAAPGLRLGYGISSNSHFLQKLKTVQDPWSVNSLAAFAGEYLFTDTEFMAKTKELISTEKKRMIQELSTWKNSKVYPSGSNFILIRLVSDHISAAEIFENLIVKRLLIRDASSFTFLDKSYLRFCVLRPHSNTFLLSELKKLIETTV